jgi:uncharacterized protein
MNPRALALGATAVGAALASTMVANSYRFEVERVQTRLPALQARLRVAFLTDLHFGPYIREGSLAAWVEATRGVAPDLVVLGGDLVEGMGRSDLAPLLRQLARLRAPCGVYTTWGNHDHTRFGDLGPFTASLQDIGIEVLNNRGVPVRDDVYLAGLDDYDVGRPDVNAALRERSHGQACLLISHNPDALVMVPEAVDLTLCGHTHGGQVRLPGVGALVKSSGYAQLFVQGWTRAPALAYVSRGLGVGLVPMRLNCPPELTVVELVPPHDPAELVNAPPPPPPPIA